VPQMARYLTRDRIAIQAAVARSRQQPLAELRGPVGDYLRRSAATAKMTSKATKITVPVMASVLV
jgi:hypothetical protein